ncbi:vacuolar segregation protein pep7 [Podospora aff. communis PSN243]|uniref:Vacuolar segregation protein pep7 n=1 Tax=Podospora aff. communis PSN243 TaxID=3040156 RepID=A0AAV9GFH4_9PEZI|nr:vacuolar segregation protein pep7 [Podospora aff. communis PSN243]
MTGRKLGGGRVLGSGKGLAPPSLSPAPTPSPRAQSPFPPSDSSTVSFHSRNSTRESISPPSSNTIPDFSQDLASNVNLGGPSRESASSSKLVCPICDEEMMTLLQLNRHIDDIHQELPEEAQDEVKNWFDKQVLKAKRFQPLAVINQKLRGLEVFESNETQPAVLPIAPGKLTETVIDPEELVTRKHWQRSGASDICTDPLCERRLGPLGGSVNCRKCGRLFCEEHTMYQMKLSRSANHEPVRGVWCRVCETCYKSREGYNDQGLSRDHTADFLAIRTKRVDRQRLEVQRLEKRLSKLTRLLADAPAEAGANTSSLLLLPGQKTQRKAIEQLVVTWEDDASVPRCPFCKQEFGSWTFRRHHCRICGRVVCADPATGCSSEVGLNVASRETGSPLGSASNTLTRPTNGTATEKPASPGHLSIDVRMCRDCKTTIFSHHDFAQSLAHKPPDQRAYETLRQFERGIRMLMPSFQRSLSALQPPDGDDYGPDKPPPTHAQIQDAAKIRKRLTDAFAKYDVAAKRIRDLKTTSPTQLRLQKAIYTSASTFLHTNLIPLKNVPRILKSNTSSHRRLLSGLNGTSSLSPLRNGESANFDPETSSLGGASEASTAVSALETEEKEARERLLILEEQKFMVQEMLKNAKGTRRFEEVGALSKNLEELDKEIEASKKLVSGVEERWEGLYSAGG